MESPLKGEDSRGVEAFWNVSEDCRCRRWINEQTGHAAAAADLLLLQGSNMQLLISQFLSFACRWILQMWKRLQGEMLYCTTIGFQEYLFLKRACEQS